MNRFTVSPRRIRGRKLIGLMLPILALVAAFCAGPSQAGDLPSAEEVIDKSIEAMGGRAAFEAIKNRVTQGTLNIPSMGITGKILAYSAPPNLSYTRMEAEGLGVVESGTDGEIVWEKSAMAGARVKEGPERASSLRDSKFNSALVWKELYATAVCDTIEMIEERPCYRIVMTPHEGEGAPEMHFYDQETHLLAKITMVAQTEMGDIPIESTISDYRVVDGIKIAHKTVQVVMSIQRMEMTLDSIEHGAEIPADQFKVPEDIMALATKAPASN